MTGARATLAERRVVSVPLCVVIDYVVAFLVLDSRWGSVFLMDDQFGAVNVVVPMAVGALLGLTQTVAFGSRATLAAMGVGLLGVLTLVLAFTLLAQAVGIAAGCVLAMAVRSVRSRGIRSDIQR